MHENELLSKRVEQEEKFNRDLSILNQKISQENPAASATAGPPGGYRIASIEPEGRRGDRIDPSSVNTNY